jgi:hypothetical protein
VLANDLVRDGPAVVTIVTPPARGTVAVGADGALRYAATPGTEGADALTYRVTDADGESAVATLAISGLRRDRDGDGFVDGLGARGGGCGSTGSPVAVLSLSFAVALLARRRSPRNRRSA